MKIQLVLVTAKKKIQNEYKSLKKLYNVPSIKHLLPRPLSWGNIAADSPLIDKGFSVWLNLEKKNGYKLTISKLNNLSQKEQYTYAINIGSTLAILHKTLNSIQPKTEINNNPYQDLKYSTGDPHILAKIEELEYQRTMIPSENFQFCHNDFNLSNLLFEDSRVTAVLDFAEFGMGFPEKDISDIIKEAPILETPLIDAYQTEANRVINNDLLKLALEENHIYSTVIETRASILAQNKTTHHPPIKI